MESRYRSVASVILLTFITCGLYGFYWLYVTSKDINQFTLREDTSGLDLILCILCFPYLIYWFYKYAKQIVNMQSISNMPIQDNSILYVLLCILGFPVVSMAIMQYDLNKIWQRY